MFLYGIEDKVKEILDSAHSRFGILDTERVAIEIKIYDTEVSNLRTLPGSQMEHDAYNGKDEKVLYKCSDYYHHSDGKSYAQLIVRTVPVPDYEKMYNKAMARIKELEDEANIIEAGE